MSEFKDLGFKRFVLVFILFICVSQVQAQEYNLVNKESSLKVYGTSSLHDWNVGAENQSGKINFSFSESFIIHKLSLVVVSESLKSGKSGMDKNTYKALKTKQYKSITFTLTKVNNITDKGSGIYEVKGQGDLSVAGTTKNITVTLKVIVTSSKITIEGEKKFKMTDFKIEPPTALLGTITTGDEINVKFLTTFK
ncbi:YceI family protein [Flavobacterium chuncheonense]|uniref:YceI family protein n=1 Tax=Flavobacterium chuncheonense TaxID=2026653 RepID=A0ABW5YNP5_9FLAO